MGNSEFDNLLKTLRLRIPLYEEVERIVTNDAKETLNLFKGLDKPFNIIKFMDNVLMDKNTSEKLQKYLHLRQKQVKNLSDCYASLSDNLYLTSYLKEHAKDLSLVELNHLLFSNHKYIKTALHENLKIASTSMCEYINNYIKSETKIHINFLRTGALFLRSDTNLLQCEFHTNYKGIRQINMFIMLPNSMPIGNNISGWGSRAEKVIGTLESRLLDWDSKETLLNSFRLDWSKTNNSVKKGLLIQELTHYNHYYITQLVTQAYTLENLPSKADFLKLGEVLFKDLDYDYLHVTVDLTRKRHH